MRKTKPPVTEAAPGAPTSPSDASSEYMTGKDAMKLLRIKPQTLYAYASRGLIKTLSHQRNRKLKLYSTEDVEKLRARGQARSGERYTATGGLRWGEPIVHTSITEISQAGPRYRGRIGTDLARSGCSFESVAELLWSGTLLDEHTVWHSPGTATDLNRVLKGLGKLPMNLDILQLFQLLILTTSITTDERDEVKHGTTILLARQLISSLVGCFGFLGARPAYVQPNPADNIAQNVIRAVGVSPTVEATAALNSALILVADHEMTPPTFSARIAASSGSDLASCLQSALCTHSGTRIHNAFAKFEALSEPGADSLASRTRLMSPKNSVSGIPGFNHPLYPRGDPRGALLIDIAKRQAGTRNKHAARIFHILDHVASQPTPALPGLEAGLVTLCVSIGMPRQSAAGLFALGRVAGWVAHVLEQRLAGIMLRPKARYVRFD